MQGFTVATKKSLKLSKDLLWSGSAAKLKLIRQPVDFRKSVDGLSQFIVSEYGENPGSGDVYIFCNRARDRLKLLYYDINGFVLHYKRLEKCRFKVAPGQVSCPERLDEKELKWLLSGLDYQVLKKLPDHYTNYQ